MKAEFRLFCTCLVLGGSIVLGMAACRLQTEGVRHVDGRKVTPLRRFWEKAVDTGGIPEGLESVRASDCGECHREIYREWSTSTHAKAWKDYQFQKEWEKDKKIFVCLNCHTPLKNQQEFEVLGLFEGDHFKPVKRSNPLFDKELRKESITCAVCHVRKGKIVGPFGGKEAPHPVTKDPEFLSNKLCTRCHQVVDKVREDLICTFTTGMEWEKSPYFQRGINCIDCHMPQVSRPLTDTSSSRRRARRHLWSGSGIAKFTGEEKMALQYFRSGLELILTPSKERYLPGEEGVVTVVYANQRAGHNIPTGDVERFIIIFFQLTDEGGEVIRRKKIRIGQVWEWVPRPKRISDNSLKPLERRTIDINFKLPEKPGRYLFTAVVENHRMLRQYALDMDLIGRYPLKAEVQRISIPILAVNY